MKVNEYLNLGEAEKSLKGYKMESVCIQPKRMNGLKLQLVADNDNGRELFIQSAYKIVKAPSGPF